jgi:hypothetical protein
VADEEGEVEFFIPNNNNLGGSCILDKKVFIQNKVNGHLRKNENITKYIVST